jgi:hypothetical protein
MNLTDELERLGKLHRNGTLNDEKFARAKSKLLNQSGGRQTPFVIAPLGR